MPQNYSKVYSKSFSSKVKRMKARMEAVRLHRALHQEKRKQVSLTRSRGLVMQRMATSAPSTPKVAPKIQSLFDDVNNMHRNLTSNEQTRQEILANMLWNLFVEPKQRRYTAKMIRFAILIAGLSFTCYSVLRRFLVLPDYSTVFRHASHDVDSNLQCLTDIYRFKMHTPRIFEKVQEQCRDCVRYGGFLAVDAISLQPHIYVTKEGFIEGVLDNDANLSSDELSVLKASYIKYEEFVKTLENKTITDSFVYVYQPLVAGLKPIPVFFDPSTQGKATSREIDRLAELSDILEEAGLPVKGLAFDGDSTYSKLHRQFFEYYYRNLTSITSFNDYSEIKTRTIASDPLHLLKRARYRLLNSRVHRGFENLTETVVSVEALRDGLDLPSIVFCNERFTKMHDKLATRLFSLDTLVALFEHRNLTALSYFLPLCFLTVSLEEVNLKVEERILFLEISLYYMLAFYGMSVHSQGPLREFKSKNKIDVRTFDYRFVQEFCNTVVALLNVMFTVNGTVQLNSVGSNPVEHFFGLIRMRSRSVHTYNKMLRTVSKVVLAKTILDELGEKQNIDKRVSYFAVNVENHPDHLRVTKGEAREIAFSLMCHFGLPISVDDLMVWDAFSAHDLANDVFEDLRARVLEIGSRSQKDAPNRGISSTIASVSHSRQILSRLTRRRILE